MMIIIEKRTRAATNVDWSEWVETTDPAPYINTALVEYRVDTLSTLDISLLTSNVVTANEEVTGEGAFDDLMETVTKHIDNQYALGRITGKEYAQVYLGAMQSTLAQSVQYILNGMQAKDKLLNGARQREVMEAQKKLYDRQRQAFDDNKYQKLLDAQLNYNGMIFQDATDPDVLNIALEAKVNDVFNRIITTDGSRTDAVVQNEVSEVAEV